MKRAYGFTIVELLIVIVVIAILATISIVAYNGIQDRTNDSVVKSDLANFAKAAQIYQAEHGVYPTVNQLDSLNLQVTKESYDTIGYNLYYCTDAPANGGTHSKFAFAAKSKSGNNFYTSSSGNGPSGTSAMYAFHACSHIGVTEVAGNLNYAYHHPTSIWRSWAN